MRWSPRRHWPVLRPVVHIAGSLVDVLQGNARDLTAHGLSGTMRRVGFQAHDARIFEALVLRGVVLLAPAASRARRTRS